MISINLINLKFRLGLGLVSAYYRHSSGLLDSFSVEEGLVVMKNLVGALISGESPESRRVYGS